MQTEHVEELLTNWDELDRAIKRVQTSLPFQLSQSIAELEVARANMNTLLKNLAVKAFSENLQQKE